jgi:hypothetical protein
VDDHTAGDRDDEKYNRKYQQHARALPGPSTSQPLRPQNFSRLRGGSPYRSRAAASNS